MDEGYVIGKAADVFGAKIYESTPALDTALQDLTDAPAPAKEEHLEPLKKASPRKSSLLWWSRQSRSMAGT